MTSQVMESGSLFSLWLDNMSACALCVCFEAVEDICNEVSSVGVEDVLTLYLVHTDVLTVHHTGVLL